MSFCWNLSKDSFSRQVICSLIFSSPRSHREIDSSWWFQPIWKNISQNGNPPQIGLKIKNIWNHHLGFHSILDLRTQTKSRIFHHPFALFFSSYQICQVCTIHRGEGPLSRDIPRIHDFTKDDVPTIPSSMICDGATIGHDNFLGPRKNSWPHGKFVHHGPPKPTCLEVFCGKITWFFGGQTPLFFPWV